MHRRAQRWTTTGLAALVLLLAATARADDRAVALYYGPEGPFAELLGAELGLVGFELQPGPLPAPIDRAEAASLFAETEAAAILDHHRGRVALWMVRDGQVQHAEVPLSDDPGIAPLVIAETLRAAAPAETFRAAAPAVPAPEQWTAPRPRIASEPAPPAQPRSESAPPPRRLSVGAAPLAVYGGRWGGGVALDGSVRLHPALSVGALAQLSGSPAGALLLRVDGRLGPVRLSMDAGPAVWWRERPSNDGTVALRPSPSWTAGLGASVDLAERWAIRGRVGLLRAGPRHRAADQEGALTLALGVSARF